MIVPHPPGPLPRQTAPGEGEKGNNGGSGVIRIHPHLPGRFCETPWMRIHPHTVIVVTLTRAVRALTSPAAVVSEVRGWRTAHPTHPHPAPLPLRRLPMKRTLALLSAAALLSACADAVPTAQTD